jgi:thioredoxin reductase
MMTTNKTFDVLIIGGSYAGLSAAMSLGRARRNVLIIDSGNPCNKQTPHSHNFITQDGKTPGEIFASARQQVEKYPTLAFYDGLATHAIQTENGFQITTSNGDNFAAKKLIFATGIKDIMPDIEGFAACWGISVIHCPYCHGYEYSLEKTGILANGDVAFELGKLIKNWTSDLTIFTNGKSTLTNDQLAKLSEHAINIVETELKRIEHKNGHIENLVFKDGTSKPMKALYARPAFEQHCDLPKQLGCELTEQNYVKVDFLQKTSVHGIYACGDNTIMMRSIANVVAAGSMAGAAVNRELIEESF